MKAKFEKINATEDHLLHVFIYENEKFDAPWHFHPEYELTFIIKGKGMRYVGNSVQEFKEGDFVLLGPNLPHCWKNTSATEEGVQSLVIQWNDSLLGENWIDKTIFLNIKKLLESASQGIHYSSEDAIVYLERLHNILVQNPLKKTLLFIELLEELSQIKKINKLSSDGFTPNLNIQTNERINTIYHYIQENYNQKLILSDIAGQVNMSEEAFCRFFKKTLNKSLFTFINEYRINMVSKLLIETTDQVSTIAYECGFESLPFFYKQFQKFMDCSPLVYRKKYHQDTN
ncbi:AraC family transcriptional regulator [Flavobacterium saccharophilum]|uniref:AraC-type DNA-binding protein n=1 Tax=Flavobacterium saccharophilum TaxID=29534 RepID=A0A1M7JJB8_9FLAO|nr:AraC family transcriptional regulator [Flavobacterium saccharophilum]SHM53142.1 AraC-type DNA-binding protein [Flavobacterium saccharophilum]